MTHTRADLGRIDVKGVQNNQPLKGRVVKLGAHLADKFGM